LQDADLMEEVIFTNPQKIANRTEEVIIFDGQIQYPDFSENEGKLVQVYQKKTQELFGDNLPLIVKQRIDKE